MPPAFATWRGPIVAPSNGPPRAPSWRCAMLFSRRPTPPRNVLRTKLPKMINRTSFKNFAITAAVLVVAAIFVFGKSFSADQVIFANDGPLGALSAQSGNMSHAWRGVWQDLNWLGIENP